MNISNNRKINSFVRRQGKITYGQLNAIKQLSNKYCIKYSISKINLNDLFNRDNKKIIEIGFGMGTITLLLAKQNINIDYIGIEVHSPGVGSLLMQIDSNKLTNIKIIQHDAVEVLENMIVDESIDGFHIFCPDPWPKKKHQKRRLIKQDFITHLVTKLKPNGYIHITTDWEHYAQQILGLLANETKLINAHNNLINHPKPVTKFEQAGLNNNRKIFVFLFNKV